MQRISFLSYSVLSLLIASPVFAQKTETVKVPSRCVTPLIAEYMAGWNSAHASDWKQRLEDGKRIDLNGCTVGRNGEADIILPEDLRHFDAIWSIGNETVYMGQRENTNYEERLWKWVGALAQGNLVVCPNSDDQPCLRFQVE